MIPVCKPWLPGKEKEYVNDTINTNWISSAGKYIDKFEEIAKTRIRTCRQKVFRYLKEMHFLILINRLFTTIMFLKDSNFSKK